MSKVSAPRPPNDTKLLCESDCVSGHTRIRCTREVELDCVLIAAPAECCNAAFDG